MPRGKLEPPPAVRRPGDRDLPVRRHKARVVEKVLENRVTLIFADTGSGKSSQVPQILSEEGLGPILCTQPRRLAVVAVAKRVAEECGCALGGEVGYQIGQLNLSTTRSKIVFKTAGILFEELRTNGTGALSRYKVVILDEVHERSVESDLVLTCLKQLLRTTSVKLVLMSATADLLKYTEYFHEIVRGEGVEKIAIQNVADKLQSVILNTKVVYLEQVVKLLGSIPQHAAVLEAMNASFAPAEKGIDIGKPIQNLVKDLIVHLHGSEPDLSKSILVFLPTYRALEEQWLLLKASCEPFLVFVLHSSIDMEQSIQAMEACPLHQRKVILATNVAESSITIPGVSFVVDACRSLEVYWDSNLKKHQPRIVWVSESQAIQRKGRTGRTCDGVVYRLTPRNHFLKFEKFETPAMQLLSLRKQVLMILCASSKALNDPAALLRKCINSPSPETVQEALEALEEMNAIQGDTKGKHQPTLYGQLLVTLPLSLESSILVVRGGQLGYPRESAVLAAILDSTPNPIIKPFGERQKYVSNLESYYKRSDNDEGQDCAVHTTIMLANLHAFEFWQLFFKNKQRLDWLVQQAKSLQLHTKGTQKSEQESLELDWCTEHRLSLSSLRSIAETVDTITESLHRFRPKFIHKLSGPPWYTMPGVFRHACSTTAPFECSLTAPLDGTAPIDGINDDPSDSWNDWSFQDSEKNISDQCKGHDQRAGSAAQHDDTPAWSDWLFEKSSQRPDERYNAHSHSAGDGEMNRVYEGKGYGQYGDNGHGDGSGQVNGSFKFGEGNGEDEVEGYSQYEDPITCASVPYSLSGTFHTLEDEQIISALVTEMQQGNQRSVIADLAQETLGDQLSSKAPSCSFFQRGICNKGSSCLYSHSPSATPMLCRYFKSASGCRFGDGCRFLHYDPQRYVLPMDNEPIDFDEPSPNSESILHLLPVLNENEVLLLFGEGDFSFADSLSNYIDPRQIMATSLDKEEVFLRDPILSQRLKKLTRLRMQVLWDVDVTSSITSSNKDSRIVSKNFIRSIPWSRVRCALWNFPFADIDEDATKHQDLMLMFFASMSIVMTSLRLPPVPVIITLCNDQYCRWQVERAARNSFFFLKTSVPLDVNTFGGYHPIRNNLRSTFPFERPLIYVFELRLPASLLDEEMRKEFGQYC